MSVSCPITDADDFSSPDSSVIVVVGIGADGFTGMGAAAQKVVRDGGGDCGVVAATELAAGSYSRQATPMAITHASRNRSAF